jgi:hypothetical protein
VNGWVTIWDVAAEPFRWGDAGEGLVALAAVAIGVAVGSALRGRSRSGATLAIVGSFGLAVAVLWSSLVHLSQHRVCANVSRREEGRVLEGVVRDLRPLTSYWQRPTDETFTVGGERIRFPLVADGCGYHRTTLEGGPIREGLRVRLWQWNGQIIRIDVSRESLLGAPQARAELRPGP